MRVIAMKGYSTFGTGLLPLDWDAVCVFYSLSRFGSIRNRDSKKVKFGTETTNKLFKIITMDKIYELNDRIYPGTKVVTILILYNGSETGKEKKMDQKWDSKNKYRNYDDMLINKGKAKHKDTIEWSKRKNTKTREKIDNCKNKAKFIGLGMKKIPSQIEQPCAKYGNRNNHRKADLEKTIYKMN